MFPLIRGHSTKPKVDVRLLLTIQKCRFIRRSLLNSCNLSYLQVNMMLRDCGLPARWWEMAWKCFTTWPKYSKRKREYVYIIFWRCLEFIFYYIYTATGVKGCYLRTSASYYSRVSRAFCITFTSLESHHSPFKRHQAFVMNETLLHISNPHACLMKTAPWLKCALDEGEGFYILHCVSFCFKWTCMYSTRDGPVRYFHIWVYEHEKSI